MVRRREAMRFFDDLNIVSRGGEDAGKTTVRHSVVAKGEESRRFFGKSDGT
jgi:hypothetical protein